MRWRVATIFPVLLGAFLLGAVVLAPSAWRALPALMAGVCEDAAPCECCAPVVETPADKCCGTEAERPAAPAGVVRLTSCPTCQCGPMPRQAPAHSGHQLSPDAPSRAPAPDAVCLIDLSPRPAAKSDGPAMVAPLDAHTRRALLNVRTT